MTAENARLLRRLGAILYDSLLMLAVLMLVTIPFVAIRGGEPVETGANFGYRIALFVVIYFFFVGYWTRSGRTLGMQSWGLRVEGPEGRPPDLQAATIRFAVAILSWAALGLGCLGQLWDPERLTWHDRASNTRLRYYPKAAKKKSD